MRPLIPAAVVALAVVLAACGGPAAPPAAVSDQAQYDPQPYENLRDGGTMTVGVREIPAQLNTFHGDTSGWSENLWPWNNPVLVTYAVDGTPQFNPDYLTDVRQDQVDGNLRVTYTINPKAHFNDGTPLDWTTFEGTWKAVRGADPAYFLGVVAGFDRITSVTRGVDDRQAVVTFKGGYAGWQGQFRKVLHPKASASPAAFNTSYVQNMRPEWGAGPYVAQTYDEQHGTVTFVRNPQWWGRPGKLDTVVYEQLESSASINAFRNGQISYTNVGTKDRIAQVQGMEGIDLRRGKAAQTGVISLNAKSPVLTDVGVRKAVLEGTDRNQLAAIEAQGLGFTEPLSGSLGLIPTQPGYQDNLGGLLTFDPQQAGRDLDAAGWAAGADGMRAKAGTPLKFTLVVVGDDAVAKARSLALAAMMKAIGVQLDIRTVASSEFSKVINGREFDMFVWSQDQPDPFGMNYLCDLYCTTGSSNVSGTGTPELDAKLRAVQSVTDPVQQAAQGNAAEKEALAQYGLLTTTTMPLVYAVRHGLANVGALPFTVPLPETVGFEK
jgi:peptide/nickel transport system substrate-binding protein